ncbi:hypothetical protein GCM10009772_24080 [Pseudonocardia alni subsp. carboxydivorans]
MHLHARVLGEVEPVAQRTGDARLDRRAGREVAHDEHGGHRQDGGEHATDGASHDRASTGSGYVLTRVESPVAGPVGGPGAPERSRSPTGTIQFVA